MSKIACGYTIATLRTNNCPMLVAAVPDGDDIEAGDDCPVTRRHAVLRIEQSMR
jgi:hypothetical protein